MSSFEFQSFPQATEEARALLARLYREIGVSAVAAALNLDRAQAETPAETLAALQAAMQDLQVRAA